ncbi:MAG: hypothetical protein WCA82_04930 [Jiangellales bacterium]
MYTSDALRVAGHKWRATADTLLLEAERLGPLEVGIFGELGTDDEGEAAAGRIDEQVDALLAEGEQALLELREPAAASTDARFQATSLLVGTLAVGDALSMAGGSPGGVFGELSVRGVQATTFAEARTTVAETGAFVTVPTSLAEGLEKIESAGAEESWRVLSGHVGKLAGGALVAGLDGVLKGAAAAAFDALREHLTRWYDVLKRSVVRIAQWVVDRLTSLLPRELAVRVDEFVTALQKKLEAGVGQIATDVYGRTLGRDDTEKAWRDAAADGRDLGEAEKALAAVTTSHTGRIAWVTKGREIIEKFDSLVAGAVAALPATAQLAFAALVAAVLGFVALQVWDGFNDVEALV